jgi:hypothetical protein
MEAGSRESAAAAVMKRNEDGWLTCPGSFPDHVIWICNFLTGSHTHTHTHDCDAAGVCTTEGCVDVYVVRTFQSYLVPASKLRVQEGVTMCFGSRVVLQLYRDCWLVVIRRLGSALGFRLFARYFVRVERKAD